jgi:hypothetical protein
VTHAHSAGGGAAQRSCGPWEAGRQRFSQLGLSAGRLGLVELWSYGPLLDF